MAAVAEPGRRRVLDALVALGEATPTALAKDLPFTRQAVSKHLAVLLDAGSSCSAGTGARCTTPSGPAGSRPQRAP